MQNKTALVVVLGTGGTIAGTAATPQDHLGYRSAQLGVQQLVAAVPGLAHAALEAEQVAQVDSKDMGPALWWQLLQRLNIHLSRNEVRGVVVTHGTDTMEETAWFLHRVLAPTKPVVLTGAMRPATSSQADGPQNLLDAVRLAAFEGAKGVLVAMAGEVHGAADVQKLSSQNLRAFASPNQGPIATARTSQSAGASESGQGFQLLRAWPKNDAIPLAQQNALAGPWPWVEVLMSHAGASGEAVRSLLRSGVQGLVVSATGNGTLHHVLEAALVEAAAQGVQVRVVSRCTAGGVVRAEPQLGAGQWPTYGLLSAAKARVELSLELMTSP